MAGVLSYAMTLSTSAFTGSLGAARGAVSGFTGGIGSLAGKLTSLPALLAGGAAGAGILGGAFKAFQAAADMESTVTSFSTLMGSTEKATALMKTLEQQAESTPNSLDELAQSARSLLSVTDDANLIPDLRMIGDLAAASQKPITDLASMYSKIKGGDIVQAEDLNQIGDALGGKALQEFAKVLGVDSIKSVRKLGSEGKINGAILDQVFRNLTAQGGMAFGAMEAQSKTSNGLLSSLKDNLTGILRSLGTPLNDLMKPMLAGWIKDSKHYKTQLEGTIALMKSAFEKGQLGKTAGVWLQLAAVKFINKFSGGIRGAIAFLGGALPPILNAAKDILFSPSVMRVLETTFYGITNLLKEGLYSAASAIAEALGFADKSDELKTSANLYSKLSTGFFETARKALSADGMADIGPKIGAAMEEGAKAGAEAYKSATSKDLIDEQPFIDKAKTMSIGLNPEAVKKILNPEKFDEPAAPPTKARGDVKDLKKAQDAGNALSDSEQEAANKKAEERRRSIADWQMENKVLAARAAGNTKLADALERQRKIEQMKLDLMKEQGLTEAAAFAAAKKRVALEDQAAGKKRRGLLDAAESALERVGRSNNGRRTLSNADRLALKNTALKQGVSHDAVNRLSTSALAERVNDGKSKGLGGKFLNPARAAEALAKGKAAADPRGGRGGPAADPEQKRHDALIAVVQEIAKSFSTLATA